MLSRVNVAGTYQLRLGETPFRIGWYALSSTVKGTAKTGQFDRFAGDEDVVVALQTIKEEWHRTPHQESWYSDPTLLLVL